MTKKRQIKVLKEYLSFIEYKKQDLFPNPKLFEEEKRVKEELEQLEKELHDVTDSKI